MPSRDQPRYGSAFDTGVYAVSPEALAQLDDDESPTQDLEDPKAQLVRTVRRRVWQALNDGAFEPPRLSHVAAEVQRVAEDPRSSAAGLARVVHQDQFLAGAVLQVANSAYYGPRGGRRITRLGEAVARLGTDRTRNVVMSATLRQSVYKGAHARTMERLWRAALGSAVAFNLLGGAAGRDGEQAFLIGLLHDVGKPVLAHILDRVLRDMKQGGKAVVGPNAASFQVLAEDVFHLMHARAGAAIITGWNLPRSFAELVDHHHDPLPPPKLRRTAAFLRLSDLIYETWLAEGDELHACERLLDHPLPPRLGLERMQLAQVLALYPGALAGLLITA